jgi:hypothetical protein
MSSFRLRLWRQCDRDLVSDHGAIAVGRHLGADSQALVGQAAAGETPTRVGAGSMAVRNAASSLGRAHRPPAHRLIIRWALVRASPTLKCLIGSLTRQSGAADNHSTPASPSRWRAPRPAGAGILGTSVMAARCPRFWGIDAKTIPAQRGPPGRRIFTELNNCLG